MRTWWRGRRRRRAHRAEEVRDELRFHHDLLTRALRAQGLDRDAAEGEARRRLEGQSALEPTLVRLAAARDRRLDLWSFGQGVVADAWDAARRLRRAPIFALGTILILAVGLGATSAVFSVANTVFLRSLPFADAARLVRIQEYSTSEAGVRQWVDTSAPTLDAARHNPALSVVSALRPVSATLVGPAGATHVEVGEVTAGWARVLGVWPERGRLFTPAEEAGDVPTDGAVISDRLWRTSLDGRADELGATLPFDGGGRVVIGVLPPGVDFPYGEDAWWPAHVGPEERGFFMWGRLAPGATVIAANAAFDVVAPRLMHDHPTVMHGLRPAARPLRENLIGSEARVIRLLAWSVAVLLLIVGSNVVMLLVTRLTSRQSELTLRAALGCGRARQMRQLAIESMLLCLSGGAAGLVLARVLQSPLEALIPASLAEQSGLGGLPTDWRVSLFTLLMATLSGVISGAVVANRAGRLDLAGALRRTARGSSAASRRTLAALVACEIGLATVLLSAALTLTGALRQLDGRDVGFSTTNLLTFHVELDTPRLATAGARLALIARLHDRLARVPGVSAVGMSTVNPLCCADWGARIAVDGHPMAMETAPMVNHRLVMPGFFDTLGIRLRSGRVFDARDRDGTEPVVVIDDRLARAYWPAGDAVGHRLQRASAQGSSWMRIVGVVSSVEDAGDYDATWYLPYPQYPTGPSSAELHVWLRVANPAVAAPLARQAVAAADPALPMLELRSMDDIRTAALDEPRLGTFAASLFALAGVGLALAGVYGLVAFVVARDERDMGIRLALGARPGGVCGAVVGRMLRVGLVGVSVGAAIARLTQGVFVAAIGGRTGSSPAQLIALGVVLLGAVALAAWVPARRVLAIDPVRALTAS